MSPRPGDAWEHAPLDPPIQLSCTIERQRCLEKWQELKLRLPLDGHIHESSHVEDALLRMYETDPACALLLQGTGSVDF